MLLIVRWAVPRTLANALRDAGYCAVVCERCGAESERRSGTSDWDHGFVAAAARSAGWIQQLDGRVARDFCPVCAAQKTHRVSSRQT